MTLFLLGMEAYLSVRQDRTNRFEVEDSGSGIPDDIVERVFQPFVSTKPFGQLMGMYLSICHGLATEQSGRLGFIRKAKGTIFRLDLPKQQ